MKLKKIYLTFIIFSIILLLVFSYFPGLAEKYYANGIYRPITIILSFTFGYIPFSLSEIIITLLIITVIGILINFIYRLIKNFSCKELKSFMIKTILAITLVYFIFTATWGFNYYRDKYAKISSYKVSTYSISELEALCDYLVTKTNALRNDVKENKNGIMQIDSSKYDLLKRSSQGYKKLAKTNPHIPVSYGYPKGLLSSHIFLYLGISGFYFPYVSEANVNILTPDCYLPHTSSHEIAHQKGFAREYEANYIGFLACKSSPYKDFQYSGYLTMLIYSMNSLYDNDVSRYKNIRRKYSKAVNRDLNYVDNYYSKYEGPIDKISGKVNDTYLKVNQQSSGVKSYGEFIDLLLADFKDTKKSSLAL